MKPFLRTVIAAATGVALLATGIPAHAATNPGPPYTGMGHCPLATAALTDPTDLQVGCVVSITHTGSVTIGSTTVPLSSPITLQFGAYWSAAGPTVSFPDGSSANVYATAAPSGGPELAADPLQVTIPGIANIIPGVTSVFAQVQLAGPVASFVPLATGEAYPVFTLPIKIKLNNALFGPVCYIGSDSHPILLHPVATDPGVIGVVPDPNGHNAIVASFTGATLSDNTFTVPGATGCGLLGALDPLINLVFGLPSASGQNAMVFGQTDTSFAIDTSVTDLAAALAASA